MLRRCLFRVCPGGRLDLLGLPRKSEFGFFPTTHKRRFHPMSHLTPLIDPLIVLFHTLAEHLSAAGNSRSHAGPDAHRYTSPDTHADFGEWMCAGWRHGHRVNPSR